MKRVYLPVLLELWPRRQVSEQVGEQTREGGLNGPPQGFLQLLDKGQAQASAGFKVPSLSGCSDSEHHASHFSQTET